MSAPPSRIDTVLKVETAEAIDMVLRPAGAFARSRAYAVDAVIRVLWLIASTLFMWFVILAYLNNPLGAIGLFLLNLFFTTWLYPVLFEMLWHGQTPGKRLFGLQVVSDNGGRLSWSASLLRNLLRLIDGLPLFYAVGMTSMLLHPEGKRLGDMLAATLVVYTNPSRRDEAYDWQNLEPLAPPVALTREEQQMLAAFAERAPKLPMARQQELAAELVRALYGSLPHGQDPLQTALRLARYVMGAQAA